MKAWPVFGIALVQSILLLAHWFIYSTWIAFWWPLPPSGRLLLRTVAVILAFSFMATALLGYRFENAVVRNLYRLAAVWLGFLNFFFWASSLCWIAALGFTLTHTAFSRPRLLAVLFSIAAVAGVYGLVNARLIRLRRITVTIPALAEAWRGRSALILSDLHLGNVNGPRFAQRMVDRAAELRPDIILIPGDLFDGTMVEPNRLVAPFKQLSAPFGVFFAMGNHEEFGDVAHYYIALTSAGIRVLDNERVTVDGLHILGIPFHDSTYPLRLRSSLERLQPPNGDASILLNHIPSRLPIVEQAGISLQLSGHTHGGQIFPFTWLTRRVFGEFTHGLHQFGNLQVYTSTGAGTWGPPMRVGAPPEIVLITFA